MKDKRKVKLRQLEKKMKELQDEYPYTDLSDFRLQQAAKQYADWHYEHFHLKFEIEHCPNCSQILPKYKNNATKTN